MSFLSSSRFQFLFIAVQSLGPTPRSRRRYSGQLAINGLVGRAFLPMFSRPLKQASHL
jgi:hypothetical protein